MNSVRKGTRSEENIIDPFLFNKKMSVISDCISDSYSMKVCDS
jgi:hypothetical protein